jgi:hypothetical protein
MKRGKVSLVGFIYLTTASTASVFGVYGTQKVYGLRRIRCSSTFRVSLVSGVAIRRKIPTIISINNKISENSS